MLNAGAAASVPATSSVSGLGANAQALLASLAASGPGNGGTPALSSQAVAPAASPAAPPTGTMPGLGGQGLGGPLGMFGTPGLNTSLLGTQPQSPEAMLATLAAALPGMPSLGVPAVPGLPSMPSMPGLGIAGLPGMPTGLNPGMPTIPGAMNPLAALQAVAQLQTLQQALQPGVQPNLSNLGLITALNLQRPQAQAARPAIVPDQVDSEIQELCDHFGIDERAAKKLHDQMKSREDTWREDMEKLWEVCEGARNPAALLMVKIREMEQGVFVGKAKKDKDVEALAKKYKLDDQARTKLMEVFQFRQETKKEDLEEIERHLVSAQRPSSLCMMLVGKILKGEKMPDPPRNSGGHKARERARDRDRDRHRSRSRSRSRSRDRHSRRSRSRGRR